MAGGVMRRGDPADDPPPYAAPGSGELARATDEGMAERRLGPALSLGASHTEPAGMTTPHSAKFRAATVVLAAIAIAALVIAASILAGGRGHVTSAKWSAWSPPDGGRLGATEIAEHVAPLYRSSPPSDQLDVVTVMNIANPSATGTGATGGGYEVAVNQGTSTSALSLLGGHTVAYNVCGIGGSNCALGGTPSAGRLLLLRREAFELALYSFKYLSGTDNVIVVLPPGHTQRTSTLSPKPPSSKAAPTDSTPVTIAVLFVRQELQPWLNTPLAQTLQAFPPSLTELNLWKQTAEAGLVDQITARGLFSEKVEQAQTGGNLLVLNQLPPQ